MQLILDIFELPETRITMKTPNCMLIFPLLAAMITISCTPGSGGSDLPSDSSPDWKEVLAEDLHLLGHRNWILVVDKAFPEQSSAGMKYIYVDEELLPTLEYVLQEVEHSTHVSPIIYRDRELGFITEDQVPGIEAFREESERILEGKEVNTLLHDEVFGMLDESSSLFRVLVIKTACTLPYTSVFLQLDCAYWGPEDERTLRERMSE